MDDGSELRRRIAGVAADRESGASALLASAVDILEEAFRTRQPIEPVARELCRAQPAMASVWNAANEAGAPEGPERLRRFAERVKRAPAAITRFALECLATDAPGSAHAPLRLVTLSFSGTVALVLEALHRSRAIQVVCSESRPALEGRQLAAHLTAKGIPVTCFTDAALAHGLVGAHAVLVGADAVSPAWFINKSGTRMLAAAAAHQGVPTYVLASRDKFVSHEMAARLGNRDGGPAEVWSDAPEGVTVLNPYFERTPLDLITAVISDVGVLGAALVPDACERTSPFRPLPPAP